MAVLNILLVLFCLFLCAKVGFSDLNCGISGSGIPPHSHDRIVNGHNISAGDQPWLVSLGTREDLVKFENWCGGSIISKRWILTAAHCETNTGGLTGRRVFYGSVNLNDRKAVKGSIEIKRVITHPDWDKRLHDIALLELAKPLMFNNKVQPICLVNAYKEVRHSLAIVTGWGSYADKNGTSGPPGTERPPTIAQEMLVPIGDVEECGPYGKREYDICAGGLKRGTEGGDSGGPLLVNKDGRWWQIGAVSRGSYLGSDWHNVTDRGLYSRVAKACPWIEKTTEGEVKCQDYQF